MYVNRREEGGEGVQDSYRASSYTVYGSVNAPAHENTKDTSGFNTELIPILIIFSQLSKFLFSSCNPTHHWTVNGGLKRRELNNKGALQNILVDFFAQKVAEMESTASPPLPLRKVLYSDPGL